MQNHTDVLIVGAGLGGLLAAATLIAERDTSNPSVRIIEASAKSGGRARTKKVEGSDLNLGAHALYKGGPLWDLLSRIGVTPDGRDPTKMRGAQPSGFYRGEVHPLPVSPMHMLTTPLLDWRGRKDIVRFFANVMSTKAMPDTLSVRSWLEEMNLSTDALAMAEGLSRLGSYSAQFDMLRANTARKMLARATRHGVLYLHHGWGALIDALETRVVSDGADILHETRARQLTRHEDGTFSVETSGDTYHSDAVILATPPRVAARLLGEDVKRWELTEARAAHLDLVLEGPLDHLPISIQGFDTPTYFAIHSRTANLTRQRGHEVVHLARYIQREEKPSRELLEADLERVIPDWRSRLVHARYGASPVVHGLPVAGKRRPERQQRENLHLVGDWVAGNEHLGDNVAESAREAARAILESLHRPPMTRAAV